MPAINFLRSFSSNRHLYSIVQNGRYISAGWKNVSERERERGERQRKITWTVDYSDNEFNDNVKELQLK